ncbi:MAG: methyltransferase domain-containing protein [Gammaproteobacteria bacterium]|nr:methyltransferase domain-containing protein [Gammaproteobacteria bacterium]
MRMRSILILGAVTALVACAGRSLDPLASEGMAAGARSSGTVSSADSVRPGSAEAIDRAISNPARTPADRARDEQRQAAAILEFFGIQPGMVVLDLYSGGGYYTELLSFIVGENGAVVAHNNTPYLKFASAEIERRYSAGRLENVERLQAENNELVLADGRFDAVLMILAYHDVYYVDEASGWSKIDGNKLLAAVYDSMKPGGVLGVIDHAATPGSPPETGGSLHRIDPNVIRADLGSAGFIFEAESDLLRNPQDDRSVSPFDASVRGRTDRVVMRFRKPWPAPATD